MFMSIACCLHATSLNVEYIAAEPAPFSGQVAVDRIGDAAALDLADTKDSTIVYSTVGRSQYAFDIYTRSLKELGVDEFQSAREARATDGVSINTNGAFDRRVSCCLCANPPCLHA